MAEWLRAIIAFGSGVAGLSAPYPHPHSTHVCPFFSLTHSSLVSFYTLTTILAVWFLTHRLWAILVSCRHFLGAPRVAEAPTHCNSRPCCCFVHPRAKSELFSPHAGPLLLKSSRRIGYVFSCILWASVSSLVHRLLGPFSNVVSRAHGLCFGAVDFPTFLLAVVTNCVLGHWVFGVSCFSVVVCGYAGSTVDYPLWSAICVNVHCVFGLLKYPVWVAAGLFWPR